MEPKIEAVVNDNNLVGEGPIWDNGRGRLIWTDLLAKKVFQLMPRTGARAVICDGLQVSGIALHKSRNIVFAGETGLHLWMGPGNYRTVLSEVGGEKLCFNDIIADPKGRIYAGTVNYTKEGGIGKPGKLYLIDTRGHAKVVDEGIKFSNGLAFSADDKTLYYADSASRRIFAYDVELKTGNLTRKRVFVQVPAEDGIPDGMTVDADGFLWCAKWYGSQVIRYGPDGRIERRLKLPCKQVSSVAFGGEDLKDLYITSASNPLVTDLMPPGYNPKSGNVGGSVYRTRVNTQGRAEHLAGLV